MPNRFTASTEVRALLEASGYTWDERWQQWVHVVSKRQLDPAVAATLTAEQVVVWIAAGRDRKPPVA
jgi:hypothetical protein